MRASRSLGVIEAVQYMRYPVWPISGYFRSKRVGEDILDIYGGVISVGVSKGYIGATVSQFHTARLGLNVHTARC